MKQLNPDLKQAGRDRNYELKDHLGNIRATLSDQRQADGSATLRSASNYYPFGLPHENNGYTGSAYRFGFQGQEKDDEISGQSGSHLSYKYRIHDARIGRFLSVDPLAKKYPFYSPYAFSGNRVVDAIEFEGLEPCPTSFALISNENQTREKYVRSQGSSEEKLQLKKDQDIALFTVLGFQAIAMAPAIFGEFALMAETSWGSLPIYSKLSTAGSKYVAGVLTADFGKRISALSADFVGSVGFGTVLSSEATFGGKVKKAIWDHNYTETLLSFLNPEAWVLNSIIGAWHQVDFYGYEKGSVSDVVVNLGAASLGNYVNKTIEDGASNALKKSIKKEQQYFEYGNLKDLYNENTINNIFKFYLYGSETAGETVKNAAVYTLDE